MPSLAWGYREVNERKRASRSWASGGEGASQFGFNVPVEAGLVEDVKPDPETLLPLVHRVDRTPWSMQIEHL